MLTLSQGYCPYNSHAWNDALRMLITLTTDAMRMSLAKKFISHSLQLVQGKTLFLSDEMKVILSNWDNISKHIWAGKYPFPLKDPFLNCSFSEMQAYNLVSLLSCDNAKAVIKPDDKDPWAGKRRSNRKNQLAGIVGLNERPYHAEASSLDYDYQNVDLVFAAANTLSDQILLPENSCKPQIEHNDGNLDSVLYPDGNGTEAANAEVEYIESENLGDVKDLNTSLEILIGELESKDWVVVCGALNDVRRLSLFHKEVLCDMLGNVLSLVVKSLKNPRSAVCKTAVMTSADIFKAYNDRIIDLLDPLLVQLLLKSSQDKRFVCEAAEKTLVAMTTCLSPVLLLPKLQTYLKHSNPRIRAKASLCFCRSVLRLGFDGIKTYGVDKLIHIAASQLSDQLPESREAARTLLLELQSVYEKSQISSAATISENQDKISWEQFCQSNLSPLSALSVLRVTNVAREGLATGP